MQFKRSSLSISFFFALLAVAIGLSPLSRVEARPIAQTEATSVAFVSEITIGAIRRFLTRYQLGTHLILFEGEVNRVDAWPLDMPAGRFTVGPYEFVVEPQTGAILQFVINSPQPSLDVDGKQYYADQLAARAGMILFEEAWLNVIRGELESEESTYVADSGETIYRFRWWKEGNPSPSVEVALTEAGQLMGFVNAGFYDALTALKSVEEGGNYPVPLRRLESPTGEWSVILNDSSEQLVLESAAGERVIPFDPLDRVGNVIWSPEGDYFLAVQSHWQVLPDVETIIEESASIWRVRVEADHVDEPELVFQPSFPPLFYGREYEGPTQISWGSWSPDGNSLLFWFGPNFGKHTGHQPWVLDVKTDKAVQLTESALTNPGYHSWSPDGSALAISVGGGRSAQVNKWLTLFDTATGEATTVISMTEQVPGVVAWSPQGDTIAYAAIPAEETGPEWEGWMSIENPAISGRRIYLLDVGSGEYERLNENDGFQDAPIWGDDGETLYYVQQYDETLSLVNFEVATGVTEVVTDSTRPMPQAVGYYGQSDWSDLLAYRPEAPHAPMPRLTNVYVDATLGFSLIYPTEWQLVNGWQSVVEWRPMATLLPPGGAVDLGPFSGRLHLAIEPLPYVEGEMEAILDLVIAQTGPGQTQDANKPIIPYDQETIEVDGVSALRLKTISTFGEVNHLLLVLLDDAQGLVLRGQGDGALFDAMVATLEFAQSQTRLTLWQMESPYGGALPDFTVQYDAAIWELRDDRLYARSNEACMLRRGGPMGADVLGTVDLAGYQWTIYNTNTAYGVQYSIPWEVGAYIFALHLSEPYTTERKSSCELLIEDVINTFQIVADED